MNIFIVDKIKKDRDVLKEIIEGEDLGFVVGECESIDMLLKEIKDIKIDLILFDLEDIKEEYHHIKEIKERYGIRFIRISDKTCKDIVEKSYRASIEYYIYKPINKYEINTMIKKIKKEIRDMERLKKIQNMISSFSSISTIEEDDDDFEKKLNYIILKLGIIGEKGSEDIIKILKFIHKNKVSINNTSIREVCARFTEKPKNMEQKIRRTINVAITNIANLGIEDYMNEVFIEYSNTLFNFEQVKKEMDYIRGKTDEKGSISMKKFISGMCMICETDSG